MKKRCKRFLGLSVVLCMVLGLFGVAVPAMVQAAESGQESEILSSSEAKKNCAGEQTGWGKINHPYLSIMTMKVLPERYASTVMVKGSWLRTVTITKSTELKLYGLYEDSRGDVYRHVGVTYQNVDYYGYILEERITVTETFAVEATPEPVYELVSEGYYDKNVIPDRYNTGCYDTATLEKINSACVVDGVEYKMGDNGNTVVLDLYYSKVNTTLPEEVVIRNKDFSDKKFAVRHSSMIAGKYTIRFENCKFATAATDIDQDMVEFYFTNCTFKNFYGSNSTFTDCFFGDSYGDAMNPFKNVTVRHCYFAGFPQVVNDGVHTDAMQVYGKADIDAVNILFTDCRIEIPIIKSMKGQSNGGINACLMVQLEYSNAKNFLFENCIINGGGYSIYAWDANKGWALEDVVFRNISIGGGHLYNDIYPKIAETVVFEDLHDTEQLYVSSVWKDDGGVIHLYVTNDTTEDKTLLVVTEYGTKEIHVPSQATAEENGATMTEELPIDIEVTIEDARADWIVCYDGTETADNQIRYVNWSGEDVFRATK